MGRGFEEVNIILKYTGLSILSMASAVPNSNASQFFYLHCLAEYLAGQQREGLWRGISGHEHLGSLRALGV